MNYAGYNNNVIWSPGDNNRLLRIYDEDIIYSTSTSYEKFYIDGDVDFYKASDKRRKENIKDLEQPLEKVLKLRGVTYNYKLSDQEKSKDQWLYRSDHASIIGQNMPL